MYVSKDEREFRLELFDGKAYSVAATGTLRELEPATELAIAAGHKSRRITLAAKDRPAVPKYRTPSGSRTGSMGAKEKVEAYLQWAKSKGLKTVTVYRAVFPASLALLKHFDVRYVDVSDFLGDAPQAEPDDDAAHQCAQDFSTFLSWYEQPQGCAA